MQQSQIATYISATMGMGIAALELLHGDITDGVAQAASSAESFGLNLSSIATSPVAQSALSALSHVGQMVSALQQGVIAPTAAQQPAQAAEATPVTGAGAAPQASGASPVRIGAAAAV